MPRTSRAAVGGIVYHVLNRGNGRMGIFRKPGDYESFVQLLADGKEVFGFCVMPNHWHLVLRPRADADLAAYLSWVTNTHVKRYRAHYRRTSGHPYQGRNMASPLISPWRSNRSTYHLSPFSWLGRQDRRQRPPEDPGTNRTAVRLTSGGDR
jgi:REP element-mobilizing transposase RayT